MKNNLKTNWIHLGLNATSTPLPQFTDMSWYADYTKRFSADGDEGRLVSMYTFSESWSSWEVHPRGSEVVICIEGRITVIQEIEGQEVPTILSAGEYVINPPGVWHTADVDAPCTALFITAGAGTEHRDRVAS